MLSINCAIDFSANLVTRSIANQFGRKWVSIISGLLAGVVYGSTIFVSEAEHPTPYLILVMAGRFTLSIGYYVHYLYAAEICPTIVRSRVLAVREAIGSIGNLISPQIVALSILNDWLPRIVFSGCGFISASLMLILPETAGQRLPISLEEANLLRPNGSGLGACREKSYSIGDDQSWSGDSRYTSRSSVNEAGANNSRVTHNNTSSMKPKY